MSRFRNYGLWVSILAFVPLILKVFGIDILIPSYGNIIAIFLSALVLAGILNNPTTENRWYLDDYKEEHLDSKMKDKKNE